MALRRLGEIRHGGLFVTHNSHRSAVFFVTVQLFEKANGFNLIICTRENTLPLKVILMRTMSRSLTAIFFIVAGTFHFLRPETYLQIMPPYLPAPQLLVAVSGFAEIAGGIGLLVHPWRRAAAWGLIALLIAVFPANIYMVQHPGQFHFAPWILWARLPLQAVFISWVWLVAIWRSQPDRIISGAPH
jgi:uncharacterized membrane protein